MTGKHERARQALRPGPDLPRYERYGNGNPAHVRLLVILIALVAVFVGVLLAAPMSVDSQDNDQGTESGEPTEQEEDEDSGSDDPGVRCPTCIAPPAPSNFKVATRGQTSIKVSWTAISGVN